MLIAATGSMVALVLAGCSGGTASGGSSNAPAGSVKEIVAAAQKEGSLNLEGLGLVFGGDGPRHPNPKAETLWAARNRQSAMV